MAAAPGKPRDGFGLLGGWLPLLVGFAILFAAGFLPPDTSLRETDARGTIAVCVPQSYPPLVTGNPDRPGFEIELVQEIAARAGWRLTWMPKPAMGVDLNPRSWHVTRAQCQMLAGGVTLSDTTRSFMDTTDGHIMTGWAMLSPDPDQTLPQEGQVAGFYAGLTGLDRIALGQYLRQTGVRASIVANADALATGLANGDFDIAVTEALAARSELEVNQDLHLSFLPEELGTFALGIGLWRGDTTLRRHVQSIIDDMAADGTLDAIADRYGLLPEVLCHNLDGGC